MAVVHVSVPPSRRMNSCGNCSFFYVLHHQVSDCGTHGRSHGTAKRLLVMFLFVSEEAVSLRWLLKKPMKAEVAGPKRLYKVLLTFVSNVNKSQCQTKHI